MGGIIAYFKEFELVGQVEIEKWSKNTSQAFGRDYNLRQAFGREDVVT